MKVYLAGPIKGLTFDNSAGWRGYAANRFAEAGIQALSPLRGKDFLRSYGVLEDEYSNLHPLSTGKGIVTRDRFDCTRADAVLVNLLGAERVSIGSVMECAWADAARRPLVIAMEEGNVHQHAMIREVAGYLSPTLDEAIDIVIAILREGAA